MFQIRRGVFETNSSSSHSISIRKNGHTYTKEEIMNGLWIDPEDGSYSLWESDLEFGRSPFEPLAEDTISIPLPASNKVVGMLRTKVTSPSSFV